MIPELYLLPSTVLAHPAELPPLPLWLQLGLAGASALVVALALTLN